MSQNKRAFLVIGPEGSGTYMLAEAFVAAGCTYCDKDSVGEFLLEKQPELLVLRRSLPHAGQWPDFRVVVALLQNEGYGVQFFGIIRDQLSAESSAMNRGAGLNYLSALIELSKLALDNDSRSIIISYEYFVASENYRKHLFKSYGLPEPQGMEFYDGNAKYYE